MAAHDYLFWQKTRNRAPQAWKFGEIPPADAAAAEALPAGTQSSAPIISRKAAHAALLVVAFAGILTDAAAPSGAQALSQPQARKISQVSPVLGGLATDEPVPSGIQILAGQESAQQGTREARRKSLSAETAWPQGGLAVDEPLPVGTGTISTPFFSRSSLASLQWPRGGLVVDEPVPAGIQTLNIPRLVVQIFALRSLSQGGIAIEAPTENLPPSLGIQSQPYPPPSHPTRRPLSVTFVTPEAEVPPFGAQAITGVIPRREQIQPGRQGGTAVAEAVEVLPPGNSALPQSPVLIASIPWPLGGLAVDEPLPAGRIATEGRTPSPLSRQSALYQAQGGIAIVTAEALPEGVQTIGLHLWSRQIPIGAIPYISKFAIPDTAINGPFFVVEAEIFSAGAVEGEIFSAGAVEGEIAL